MKIRLTGARIWDGTALATTQDAPDLVIEEGRIAAIGPFPEGETIPGWSLPAGAVAIPGLIDAHVHMDLDPHLMAPDAQFKASRADRDRNCCHCQSSCAGCGCSGPFARGGFSCGDLCCCRCQGWATKTSALCQSEGFTRTA